MPRPCCNITGYGSGLGGFDVHAPGCPSVRHRECGRPWGDHKGRSCPGPEIESVRPESGADS